MNDITKKELKKLQSQVKKLSHEYNSLLIKQLRADANFLAEDENDEMALYRRLKKNLEFKANYQKNLAKVKSVELKIDRILDYYSKGED